MLYFLQTYNEGGNWFPKFNVGGGGGILKEI